MATPEAVALFPVGRADALIVALANRHYPREGKPPACAVGSPARTLILRDFQGMVGFVWTWPRDGFRRDGQTGANCELFRNESGWRSSDLILAAEAWVRHAWPDVGRAFTYVDPAKVQSRNPGYCFLCASWERVGRSRSGKILLAKDFGRAVQKPPAGEGG